MQRTITISSNGLEEYNILSGDKIIYDRDVEPIPGEFAILCVEQSKFFGIYEGRDEHGNHILRYLTGGLIKVDPSLCWTRAGRVLGIAREQCRAASGAVEPPHSASIGQ